MRWLKWTALALSAIEAGWMTFDGCRAFAIGDYVTPKTGEYAGQLGPWTHIALAVGIEPRSTLMKTIFIGYGICWLAITFAYAQGRSWAWVAMLVAAIGTLWYLWIGTITSVIVITLLLLVRASTLD